MLTPGEFADALRKGLGRAVLAVNATVSQEFEEVIFAACQEDQRHDPQFEDSRGPFLMAMVERAGLIEKARKLIVTPIEASLDDWDRLQRMRMIGEFAQRSDLEAIRLLQEYASMMDSKAWGVLANCGELEWLVENILPIVPVENKWEVMLWADLDSDLSAEIKAKLSAAYEECTTVRQKNPEVNEKNFSFESLIQRIEQGDENMFGLRQIGPSLSDAQVIEVANRWLPERDIRKGMRYAGLFKTREFPLPIEVITNLVYSDEPPVGFDDVLSEVNHPMARELGLWLISKGDYRGYICLSNSYRDEDLPAISAELDKFKSASDDDLHMLSIGLRQLVEDWHPQVRKTILRWVYEYTPCSTCRSSAAKMMVDDGTLPDDYRREMQFDADAFCRELALAHGN